MADQDAESVGGISVSVGASHKQLVSDLAEADRIAENWAKSHHYDVQIGAQVGAAGGGQSSAVRAVQQETQQIEQATSKRVQAVRNLHDRVAQATEQGEARIARVRRKNIRANDIGTAADAGKVYTFDPSVYEEEERKREAASKRQQELLIQRQIQRAERAAAVNPATAARARAANYLNANPPDITARGGVGATDINSPGYRSNEEIEREQQRGNNRVPSPAAARQSQAAAAQAAFQARRDAFDRAQSAATAAAFQQSQRARQFEIDEQQQARQIAARRASITGSGRTSRTLASGLGALFGGTEGRQIEAQVAASQAARQLASAERAIAPLDQRLRELGRTYASARGETRQFAGEQIAAIKGSDQYRGALLNVERAVRADAAAQAELNKISGASSVARNLLAITAAGAAFSIGLKAVDTVIAALVPAVGNYLDIQTGFGATSTRVTTALAQQTLALHGNVQAALAMADAQATLSTSASDYVDQQLKVTTQVKAGAQAQQQASDLFRAAAGVGNAPSGLTGGYGGIGGTGLFAQQLGGGRGFSETVQQDISAFKGRSGPDLLGNVNQGLGFITNPEVRKFLTTQAANQGNIPVATAGRTVDALGVGAGLIGGIPGGAANTLSALNPFGQNFLNPFANSETGQLPTVGPLPPLGGGGTGAQQVAPTFKPTDLSEAGTAYLKDLEDAGKRGAAALGDVAAGSYAVARSEDERQQAIVSAAAAGDTFSATMAAADGIVLKFGDHVASAAEHVKALETIAVGKSITPPDQLGRLALAQERQREIESAASLDAIKAQQAFTRPSIIAQADRQQQYALNTQLPAQAALGALASPNVAVGTGIVAANAQEQKQINSGLKEAVGLQRQLDDYYAQGKQTLVETYQVPPALLASVEAVGKAIASTQASISNEQAAYQVAQYNFQLQLAKRSLSDIGGLTGRNFGAGQSYLGVLERENLALSRQGQLLQFNLSQRQINFQQALAGFQAPGVTPEERQARIKEAQIEADFAQKQLNIQKQIFGNQVQIVDISNLRQGADLAKQIGLLLQGRQVTIDTAVAEQRLLRLQQVQAKNVAQVSTYLTRVDNLAASAFGQIQQLEAAAGKAMAHVATDVLAQFGLVITGLSQQLNALSSGTSGGGGGGRPSLLFAGGGVMQTNGPTRIGDTAMAGEAAGETLIVLSHPRALAGMGDGGGSVPITINFGDVYVREEQDIDEITRKVTRALGRDASVKGLRGIG